MPNGLALNELLQLMLKIFQILLKDNKLNFIINQIKEANIFQELRVIKIYHKFQLLLIIHFINPLILFLILIKYLLLLKMKILIYALKINHD